MKELGDYLRQAREERNISLRDIQEITKIRLRYLEAIEAGEFTLIPGEVYRKGFIVNYANAVGLDSEEVLRKYYELTGAKIEPEKETSPNAVSNPRPNFADLAPTREIKAEPKESILDASWINGVLLGVGAALIVLILFMMIVLPTMHHKVSPAVNEPKHPETPAAVTKAPPAPVTYPAPVYVEAEFTEPVWVKVRADGNNLFGEDGRTFNTSDGKQYWSAQTLMEIRIGNPLGVRLTRNGKYLGQIGKYKEAITVKVTPTGFEAP